MCFIDGYSRFGENGYKDVQKVAHAAHCSIIMVRKSRLLEYKSFTINMIRCIEPGTNGPPVIRNSLRWYLKCIFKELS